MKDLRRCDLTNFHHVFRDSSTAQELRRVAPSSYAAASRFWTTILKGEHLSSRIKELILLSLHASVSSLNSKAIHRHVERALSAGATPEDVMDVLLSIVGVANHALYTTVPILMDELRKAGHSSAELPELTPKVEEIKKEFIQTRGFWNEQRDAIARLMPDYFCELSNISMEPWKSGTLSPKEREFIYIAIDCSPTHTYGVGLAMHIRHALKQGATKEEILEIFQLAASMGLEGYILGAEALFSSPNSTD